MGAAPAKKKKKGGMGLFLLVIAFFGFVGAAAAAGGYYYFVIMPGSSESEEIASIGADAQEQREEAERLAREAREQAEQALADARDQANDATEQAGEALGAIGEDDAEEPSGEMEEGLDEPEPEPEVEPEPEPEPEVEPEPEPEAEAEADEPGTDRAPRDRVSPRQTAERRVRAEVRSTAQQCFRQAGARGQVTVQISIGYDGRVTSSRVVQNSTGDQNLARCISGALIGRRISGSIPRGGMSMQIPFSA